ncbi:AbrB/MazE/SpoVT family DNA-binding domain-containing protein [Nanoarchaeota archaeon]
MQIRRLVRTGSASFTTSLPKDWISKHNLKKGDLLYLKETENSDIMISFKPKDVADEMKEIVIEVDNANINTIRRKTISAYINNYNLFHFIGQTLDKKLPDIRKILHNFLALEIQEQSSSKLTAKDFLNLEEFNIDKTIRRMDMLTRSILLDCKKTFDGEKVYDSLYYRDFEVDKLFFLISRLIRAALVDPKKAKAYGITNVQALSMWNIAKGIERVADSVKNISKELEGMKKTNKDYQDLFNTIERYYLDTAKAFFTSDKKLADKIIADKQEVFTKIDALLAKDKDAKMIHKLKNVTDNIKVIAKITLDFE